MGIFSMYVPTYYSTTQLKVGKVQGWRTTDMEDLHSYTQISHYAEDWCPNLWVVQSPPRLAGNRGIAASGPGERGVSGLQLTLRSGGKRGPALPHELGVSLQVYLWGLLGGLGRDCARH